MKEKSKHIPHDREKSIDCKCDKSCDCCESKKKIEVRPKVKKAVLSLALLCLSVSSLLAQEPNSGKSFWADPINSPQLTLYLTLAVVAVTIVLLAVVLLYVVKVLNIMVWQAEIERAAKLGIPLKARASWWQKMWDQMNAAVPVEREKDIELDHNYDGIRELDNHLPPWWTGLFYATIIWGVVYLVVYHVTDNLPLSQGEYQNELAAAEEQAKILKASQPQEAIDENTIQYTSDEAILSRGKTVFVSNNCGSCHRNDGGGNGIGPNLTDEYWLHGGSIKNIFVTIDKGFVEKGMPAWGNVMSRKDVRDVAFYIMSLQGTNPADAKAPQGELYQPAPGVESSDSTKTAAAN
jgi:cytochrome c oxidase cbb3-type subunit III